MAVALHGNLKYFGIGDVFQLIGQQRKSGVLEIATARELVALQFHEGAVVFASPEGEHEHAALADLLGRCGILSKNVLAELETVRRSSRRSLVELILERKLLTSQDLGAAVDLLTQETIFALLRRKKGTFHFSARPVTPLDLPLTRLAAEQILMDGLRMVDEWRAFSAHVPSDEIVFRRVGTFEDYRARAGGGAGRRAEVAERVLRLVDGRLTARRVIDLSRLGTFAGTRVLADLREAGLIEPGDPRQRARRRLGRRVGGGVESGLGRALAATLPLVGLALLLLVAGSAQPAGSDGSLPIARGPLEEARRAFAALRLRNALDAYRFATGQWPSRLEELVERGFVDSSELVASPGEPYYYRHRAEGVLLLAPEN